MCACVCARVCVLANGGCARSSVLYGGGGAVSFVAFSIKEQRIRIAKRACKMTKMNV